MSTTYLTDPHAGQPVRVAGAPIGEARVAVVMIHGRGALAESILSLAPSIDRERVAYLAPQASGSTWYPYSFLSQIESNEPGISSGMRAIERLVEGIAAAGIPPERTLFVGFSQGACLASEFVARHARRWGGLAVLSGGLIGPDGTSRDYPGDLVGTPVFIGCSDVDGHVPVARVHETAEVLEHLGGQVTLRLYPGMGHFVNEDEIDAVGSLIDGAIG